jgi:uncharacterized membrane protein YhaH (DUF805 family)
MDRDRYLDSVTAAEEIMRQQESKDPALAAKQARLFERLRRPAPTEDHWRVTNRVTGDHMDTAMPHTQVESVDLQGDQSLRLLSWSGRVGRVNYFVTMFVSCTLGAVAGAVGEPGARGLLFWPSIGVLLLCAYISGAVVIKRCHDLGKSGWWSALAFVPIVNLGLGIYLLFWRGQDTANRFGRPPAVSPPIDTAETPRGDVSAQVNYLPEPPVAPPKERPRLIAGIQVADEHWERAYTELHSPARNLGVWARAFATAEGEQAAAEACYLRWRAEEFHLDATRLPEREHRDAMQVIAVRNAERLKDESASEDEGSARAPLESEFVPLLVAFAVLIFCVWAANSLSTQ